jgi:hypothetical protein
LDARPRLRRRPVYWTAPDTASGADLTFLYPCVPRHFHANANIRKRARQSDCEGRRRTAPILVLTHVPGGEPDRMAPAFGPIPATLHPLRKKYRLAISALAGSDGRVIGCAIWPWSRWRLR